MISLILISSSIICFFAIKYAVYKFTFSVNFPKFIEYQPYDCYKCCGFWTNVVFFSSIGYSLHLWLFMAVGLTFTILDTIALIIHEYEQKKYLKNEKL